MNTGFNQFLVNIIDYYQSHDKLLKRLLLVLTGLLLVVFIVSRYSVIKTDYQVHDGIQDDGISSVVIDKDGSPKNLGGIFGFSIVKRSDATIVTKHGRAETRNTLHRLPWLGFKNITINLYEQREVEKIGSRGYGCELINDFGSFTYNCADPSKIAEIQRPSNGRWGMDIKKNKFYNKTAVRYKDGFLSLDIDPHTVDPVPEFIYTTPGVNKITTSPTTAELESDSIFDYTKITNTTDRKDSGIVLAEHKNGFLYYFKNINDNKPAKFTRKTDVDLVFDLAVCSMTADTLYCYYGPGSLPPDSTEETEYREENPHGYIETHSLSNPEQQPEAYKLDNVMGIDELHVTESGDVFAYRNDGIYGISLGNGRAGAYLITEDFTDLAVGSEMYYVGSSGLFRYDSGYSAAYLVFSSDNLRISSVSTYGDQVIFNSFVDSSELVQNIPHSYLLTDEPAADVRKEDFLPYSDGSLPIVSMDYDESRIYVHLQVDVISDHQTGQVTFDKKEFNRAKNIVETRLRKDGLLKGDVKTIYEARW